MSDNLYKYPIALTQQFRHCGNPLRIDTYKGCDFGCKYCFANARNGDFKKTSGVADFEIIKKAFKTAFDSNKESKNILIELLRHRVPLHLGGMSDPFQRREFEYEVTYELLKLSNEYNYPLMICTKTDSLPDKYLDVLNPEIHAFQISLFSMNDEVVRKFESNTPSPKQRVEFMRNLHERGFWVGLRIQPLIYVEDAIEVVKTCNDIVNFITVEHLKIATDNKLIQTKLFELTGRSKEQYKKMNKDYQLPLMVKKSNIDQLKAISKVPIGCGDNDLHEYSDTNNCCGIDTINDNFDGWIKYNSMYINKTDDRTQWYPKSNCSSCLNSQCRINGFDYHDYVENYIANPKLNERLHDEV